MFKRSKIIRDENRRKLYVPLSLSGHMLSVNCRVLNCEYEQRNTQQICIGYIFSVAFEKLREVSSRSLSVSPSVTTKQLTCCWNNFSGTLSWGVVLLKLVGNTQILLKSEKITSTLHECLFNFEESVYQHYHSCRLQISARVIDVNLH